MPRVPKGAYECTKVKKCPVPFCRVNSFAYRDQVINHTPKLSVLSLAFASRFYAEEPFNNPYHIGIKYALPLSVSNGTDGPCDVSANARYFQQFTLAGRHFAVVLLYNQLSGHMESRCPVIETEW